MQDNYSINALDIKDIKIKKITKEENNIYFHITTKTSEQTCPCCGEKTSSIHDHRIQKIKDIAPIGVNHYLMLDKKRYICHKCGKKFYEKYDFLQKGMHRTKRLTESIIYGSVDGKSMTQIAKENNVSTTTVSTLLSSFSCARKTLPKVLGIDEFKGNLGNERFQVILTNVEDGKHQIYDILPDRKELTLIEYFKSIPIKERLKVEFVTMDLWKPYKNIVKTYLPNAKIVADKYHYVRLVGFALERIRTKLQKNMTPDMRKYYKHSKSILRKKQKNLTSEQEKELQVMLLYNDDLRVAYNIKEEFYRILQIDNFFLKRKAFNELISWMLNSYIPEFKDVAKTFYNWEEEILNSFRYPKLSNATTEGFNTKIKALKRCTYGFRNFKRSRNRILLSTMFNN